MPYQITKNPDYSVEIEASLDPPAVEEQRTKIARGLRGRVRVPGFRQGKAPLSAVQVRFAEEIREELTEQLVGHLWREILDSEEGFEPLTRPDFDELKFQEDGAFGMKARLEIRPAYDLPEIDEIQLPEIPISVTETEIDGELEKIAEEQASWEPAESNAVAADGMMVEADMTAEVIGTEDEPKTEENARFVLGDGSVPAEINEALQGSKVDDERTAESQLPNHEEAADGTHAVRYSIKVKALKEKALPEIDDALAQGFGIEDLAELRRRIEDSLRQQQEGARRERWRRTVLDHLEAELDGENLPPALVTDAVNEDLQRFAYSLAMQGQTPNSDQLDWQAMRERFEPEARKRVLDTLVLEQLASAWEIPVPEEDVDDYVAMEAQRKGIPAAEHKANLASENHLERIRHSALLAKTVSMMLNRAGAEEDA